MDRNSLLCGLLSMLISVALRKESVDRNTDGTVSGSGDYVALRKESVDRNAMGRLLARLKLQSLSVRRAWIEIDVIRPAIDVFLSLSVRRAWIEILILFVKFVCFAGRSP